MRQILSTAGLCLLAAASFPASAQDNAALQPGARVKLITPRLDATHQMVKVLEVTSDSIQFRSVAHPVSRTIALSDVSAIEVRTSSGRPFARYMLRGAGWGAGVGAALAYATWDEQDCPGCMYGSRGSSLAVGGIAGTMFGLVAGSVAAAVKPRERWTRISLSPSVSFRPVPAGRFALTISRSL